jgi:hypothetical protein
VVNVGPLARSALGGWLLHGRPTRISCACSNTPQDPRLDRLTCGAVSLIQALTFGERILLLCFFCSVAAFMLLAVPEYALN